LTSLEHPLDGTGHYVLAVLIFDGVTKAYDTAIPAARCARTDNLNEDFHRIAGEERSFEGHPVNFDESEANAMDAPAQNY
jgi:hypothetical protein